MLAAKNSRKRSEARSPAAAMMAGSVVRGDENVFEVKLLPTIACSDAVIVRVHAALIPRNELSPAVIFLVAPTLGHPGTVAVKLGFKDMGRRYPEYRFETCHLYFSRMCVGGARSPAAAISP